MEKILFLSAPTVSKSSTFEVSLAGITYPDPDYGIFRKCSDIYVVEYISDGEGTVMCGGDEYHPKKGDAYILQKGKEHKYFSSPDNPWEKKWMNISGALCENLISAYGITDTVYFPNASVGEFFDEFIDFCEHNTDIYKINEFGAVIFHRIVQRLAANAEINIRDVAKQTKRYIDSNIYEKLSAESAARNVGFSVSQLGRIFKKEYGKTVYSYILDRKMDTAENLLINTNLSVREISDMLQFTDEHYFCNIFKIKRRMTPKECRRGSAKK